MSSRPPGQKGAETDDDALPYDQPIDDNDDLKQSAVLSRLLVETGGAAAVRRLTLLTALADLDTKVACIKMHVRQGVVGGSFLPAACLFRGATQPPT